VSNTKPALELPGPFKPLSAAEEKEDALQEVSASSSC
jgi:hypothetical protein